MKISETPPPLMHVDALDWRGGVWADKQRALPEEIAVALSYDRTTFAVMMASPADLEDFAIGFSLSEGIISSRADILDLEIMNVAAGTECRMTLAPQKRAALEDRRRYITGPVGCGLCGLDRLEETAKPLPVIASGLQVTAERIAVAVASLWHLQVLNNVTHAVHGAAFVPLSGGEVLLREDVGRHNALDKLIGAVTRRGDVPGSGAVLLTSRVSIDLIQKTAIFGAPVLVAISVPTARAVREAKAAGITLIAVARDDGFEIFTHPERVIPTAVDDDSSSKAVGIARGAGGAAAR